MDELKKLLENAGLREGYDGDGTTDHEKWMASPEAKARAAQQRKDGLFKDVDDRGWPIEPVKEYGGDGGEKDFNTIERAIMAIEDLIGRQSSHFDGEDQNEFNALLSDLRAMIGDDYDEEGERNADERYGSADERGFGPSPADALDFPMADPTGTFK